MLTYGNRKKYDTKYSQKSLAHITESFLLLYFLPRIVFRPFFFCKYVTMWSNLNALFRCKTRSTLYLTAYAVFSLCSHVSLDFYATVWFILTQGNVLQGQFIGYGWVEKGCREYCSTIRIFKHAGNYTVHVNIKG